MEDEELNAKMMALVSKQKQVKEATSLEKLTMPSHSLRSIYNDILSVKVRPKSAGKSRAERSVKMIDSPEPTYGNRAKSGSPDEAANGTDVVDIMSPKRGKIRPKSAPFVRKEESHDSPNDGSDDAFPKKEVQKLLTSEKRLREKSNEFIKCLDVDAWWEDIAVDDMVLKRAAQEHKVQMNRTRSAPVVGKDRDSEKKKISSNERAKNYKPNFNNDVGHQFLKVAKKKERKYQEDISRKILEEANIMQAKCYTGVEEANSYAKYLGIRKRYAVFIRNYSDLEHSRQFREQLRAGTNFGDFGSIKGAGDRIGKMAVEVSGEPGEPTSLISVEKFFREHESLHAAVRKHRSLIPASQQVLEAKNEHKIERCSPAKQRRRGAVLAGAKGEGAETADKSATEAYVLPRSPTAFVDYFYEGSGQQPMERLNRKETEEYLRKILDNTVGVTKVLEEQLLELQSRGWNESLY